MYIAFPFFLCGFLPWAEMPADGEGAPLPARTGSAFGNQGGTCSGPPSDYELLFETAEFLVGGVAGGSEVELYLRFRS